MVRRAVSDDVTLDQFRADEETSRPAADEERDGAEGERNGARRPPQSTCHWAPDGRSCAVCEESATRLWRRDDRLVCSGCTDWDE